MSFYLTIEKANKIIFNNQSIELESNLIASIKENFHFLAHFQKNKIIYGINTGFGPMLQHIVSANKIEQLQKNLIRSHACGAGEVISVINIRSIILSRLVCFLQAYSGVHLDLIYKLKFLLDNQIYPLIYEHGGVGASGDLVQLAHLALALLGEGEVLYNNKIQKTITVFRKLKHKPLKIQYREGLALLNGTSAMTGIAIINLYWAKKIIHWTCVFSCIINELGKSYNDHYCLELNRLKNHEGQLEIAKIMNNYFKTSRRLKNRKLQFYNIDSNTDFLNEKFQENYSLRCVTQILGPILDTYNFTYKIIEEELNSVNDNPIIDSLNKEVYHGGNFHGDSVSLEMDKLKLAITKISLLLERQLNFLMNPTINKILPPFLNQGKIGFNFGLQGLQFTAVSTAAENQTLSQSMYIHSLPNNNDNQDIVSMGANSALLCQKVINNTFQVLAIHFVAVYQSLVISKNIEEFSKETQQLFFKIKNLMPNLKRDEPLGKYLPDIINFLKEN